MLSKETLRRREKEVVVNPWARCGNMIHGIRVSSKRRVLGQGVAPHRAGVEGLEIAVNESGHDDNAACQKVQMSVMKTKRTVASKVI